MDELEKEYELKRLERVLKQIHYHITAGAMRFQGARTELHHALVNYWENCHSDFWEEAQLTEMIERQRSLTAFSYKRQAQFKQMAMSPYFGRIDFVEEYPESQVQEQVYIGIGTLTDTETRELLIYDWRSPIAGMFYDFELGRAEYQSPAGKITGKITLKRQYKIVNGRMEYMFDSDLKIDDEILQQLLSRSADEKMRTIVSSIQREQNRAIRDATHRLLLVRGPAGSGKTSIALHRAAYLLYKERNAITAKNILIFSPNSIFSDYISNVLPELGEENVLQTTFRDYVKSYGLHLKLEIEEGNDQLEYLFTPKNDEEYNTRISGINYKSSPEFAGVIQEYLVFLERSWIKNFPAIELNGRKIFNREEWESLFFNDLSYLPLAKRLAHIKRLIQVKLRPFVRELRREKELKIAATGEEVNEKTIKALARLEAIKETQPLLTEIDALTEVDSIMLYKRLFEDDSLFCQFTAETKLPGDWRPICAQTLAWFDKGCIPYEDLFPILYLQGKLYGFPVKNNIRHLIIDEAQDYTVLQYEILKNLFPKSTWTILGDPDQSIRKAVEFETIAQILDRENPPQTDSALILSLNRSYRSTMEIQAFCRALLPGAEKVEHVNRSGPQPKLVKLASLDLAPVTIIQAIQEQMDEGARSVAVICKTARETSVVYESLKKIDKQAPDWVHHVTDEDSEFHSGIVVIPVYLAKGLEFDAVFVYDVSSTNFVRDLDRNLLYISCTRALHRLTLLYCGELSPFIAGIDKDLYLKEEPHS